MSRTPVLAATTLAMLAFAGNSLLCRLALKETGIDAGSFTSLRILSGALVLCLVVRVRTGSLRVAGDWPAACALFTYAACFSYAYVSLPTGTGALLLFGAVQVTMLAYGWLKGERLHPRRIAGLLCAFAGIVGLVLPGVTAPAPTGALLMLAAGIAWGLFSIRGKGTGDPTCVMAGSFARAAVPALVLSMITFTSFSVDGRGVTYALLSGAVTSGIGYVIWYTALRGLSVSNAATVQLTVPALAAAGGVLFLAEPVTLRLLLASAVILGGIALALGSKTR